MTSTAAFLGASPAAPTQRVEKQAPPMSVRCVLTITEAPFFLSAAHLLTCSLEEVKQGIAQGHISCPIRLILACARLAALATSVHCSGSWLRISGVYFL